MEIHGGAWPNRNNYIDDNYFSIPDFSLQKSIDLVKISKRKEESDYGITCFLKRKLYSFLGEQGFQEVPDVNLLEGNYLKKRTYKSNLDDTTVDIISHPKASFFPPLMIAIHDPTYRFMLTLNSFLKDIRIDFTTSYLELAFDCFTEDIWALYDLFKATLFLKQQRTTLYSRYLSSFYPNNPWKSSRGARLYVDKNSDKPKFVRLELVLKRQVLRRLNLEFPFDDIDSLNFFDFIDFRVLDEEHLLRHNLWLCREQIREAQTQDPKYYILIERTIESWVDTVVSCESLMEKVEKVREDVMIKNHSRFLKPFDELTMVFEDALDERDFFEY